MTTAYNAQAAVPGLSYHYCRFGIADWTDGDTSQTINLGDALPANAVVLGASVHVVEAVVGTSLSAFVVDVGDASDDDCYVDGLDIFGVSAGARKEKPGSRAAGGAGSSQLKAVFTSTGCNLDDLTAGQVDVVVIYQIVPSYDAD